MNRKCCVDFFRANIFRQSFLFHSLFFVVLKLGGMRRVSCVKDTVVSHTWGDPVRASLENGVGHESGQTN